MKKSLNRIKHLEFRDLEIVPTNHFIQRWKERIDPNMSIGEILSYIKYLSNIKWGICNSKQDHFILDNDIVIVACKSKDNKIILVSVLGRISENPILTNIEFYSKQVYNIYGKVRLGHDNKQSV
jgi:hypothetical protein